MPAITQVFFYSDTHWPAERVLADAVVRLTLSWQAVEGEEGGREDAELYLTNLSRQDLEKTLAGWFELGHRPGAKAGAGAAPAKAGKSKSMRFGPEGGPNSAVRREYWGGWKEWTQGLGLKNKDGVHEVWQTSSGNDGYHPIPVCEAYELHLAGRDEEALAKVQRWLPSERRVA
jgi:hypothetical protein